MERKGRVQPLAFISRPGLLQRNALGRDLIERLCNVDQFCRN